MNEETLNYLRRVYSNSSDKAIEEFYNHPSCGESGRWWIHKWIKEDQRWLRHDSLAQRKSSRL